MKLTRKTLRKIILETIESFKPVRISQEAWMKALRHDATGSWEYDYLDKNKANLIYIRDYDHRGDGSILGAVRPANSHYIWGDDPETMNKAMEIQNSMDAERMESDEIEYKQSNTYQESDTGLRSLATMINLSKEAEEEGQISREEFIKFLTDSTSNLSASAKERLRKLQTEMFPAGNI